ncbi:MAG: alpha-galactosidase [Brevinematales bacterium]|nr:alpha-galactosidase [Brevinematales bacterium]
MLWKRSVLTYLHEGKPYTIRGSLPLRNEHLSLETEDNTLVLHTEVPLTLVSFETFLPWTYQKDDRLFVHGFQSWSDTREFMQKEKIPGLPPRLRFAYARYHLEFYGDYHFYVYSRKRGHLHSHGWTLSGKGEKWHLVGSLDEYHAYTIFEHHPEKNVLRIVRDVEGWLLAPGRHCLLSLFFTSGEILEAQRRYLTAAGLSFSSLPKTSGWTSWYNYYTNISEEIILSNLQAFKRHRIPIDIFQIDDGYQTAVGDWLSLTSSFPRGMKSLTDEIHNAGYNAGLWLAPFICESKSDLFRNHPDWILRYPDGSFVIAGYSENWNGNFYALDLDHPEVKTYLERVFHTILHEWNFDMVKLDFLYAASIFPHNGKTRAYQMSEAMSWLRQLIGEKRILGCGVPISSALGKVDYCRIGCDVGLDWEDIRPARIHFRERISTVKALATTIGRYPLHRLGFLNDPDVFILRENNQRLSAEQRYTLFMVNHLLGGLIFTSDDIASYTPHTLHVYKKQFPLAEPEILSLVHHHETYHFRPRSAYIQAIGPVKVYEAHYTGWVKLPFAKAFLVINLGHTSLTQSLPEGIFFDPLTKTYHTHTVSIPPYATRIFLAIQPSDTWSYGGSTEHIFPGCGFSHLEITPERLFVNLHPHTVRKESLFLVSQHPTPLSFNGHTLPIHTHPLGFSFIHLTLEEEI